MLFQQNIFLRFCLCFEYLSKNLRRRLLFFLPAKMPVDNFKTTGNSGNTLPNFNKSGDEQLIGLSGYDHQTNCGVQKRINDNPGEPNESIKDYKDVFFVFTCGL